MPLASPQIFPRHTICGFLVPVNSKNNLVPHIFDDTLSAGLRICYFSDEHSDKICSLIKLQFVRKVFALHKKSLYHIIIWISLLNDMFVIIFKFSHHCQ